LREIDKVTIPLVSIITPTFNHRLYIAEAITSVIEQTFEDWELIIIDDGSFDNTPEIVKKFQNPKIHFYQQEHKGIYRLSEIYNFALDLAKGELIAILEGDDKWPQNKLEKQAYLFHEDPEIIFSWGQGEIIDSQGRKITRMATVQSADLRVDFSDRETLQILYRFNFLTPTSTVMVRKSALKNIGGFHQPPGTVFLDYPTWLILAAHSKGKFTFLNTLLGYWRTSQTQVTVSRAKEMYISHDKVFVYFYQHLQDLQSQQASYDSDLEANFQFYKARVFLDEKNWPKARVNFLKCLSNKGLKNRQKIFSAIGLLSSFLKIDLISFARWIKRNSPFAFSHERIKR
jgi:glycosyltransferase involved in cell wall biosynthesis